MSEMNKRIAIEEGDQDQGTIVRALPHHVIYEILARLPLKSLMRFKAVSKEWLYTIHDQSLATEFLIYRSLIHTAAPTCLISFSPLHYYSHYYSHYYNHYYSLDLDSSLATPFENLNQPEFEGAKVLNTVMGLTCFEAKGITYFWNLRTREITALPQTDPDFRVNSKVRITTSLGFDPVKGQYKILKTWSLSLHANNPVPKKICHKVITLGTSEWRKIDDGFPMGEYEGPVSIDGKLHYLTFGMHWKNILVTFHVGTEKFEVTKIPEAACPTCLIPYRDCLAFVDFKNPANEVVMMTVGVLEDRKWVVKDVELPRRFWKQLGNLYASGISTGEILLTPIYTKGHFTKKTLFYVYRYDMEKRSMKEVEIHGLPDNLLIGQVIVDCPPIEYGESILSLKKLNLQG